jgi:two-component system, NtrC family, sensor kinase
MVTRSKSTQNRPLPTHVRLPEQMDPSVDMFIVHDERIEGVVPTPSSKTPPDISQELSREADYEYHNILLRNKVAELSARIARELNNPLGTILVYVQLLLARGNLDESSRECLQTIYKEAQRADAISTELISFARRGKPEKSLISIQEVIQKSLELLIPRLRGSNIEVVVKLQPDMPKTMADPHQMQRVFTNIIANAEQAMTEAHGKGRLHVKGQVAGEIIRITFDDDGPGIKPKDLKTIFDPFFSTKEAGLGLGLSICCAILEGHGGCIYATNKPEKGATFVVELPIAA